MTEKNSQNLYYNVQEKRGCADYPDCIFKLQCKTKPFKFSQKCLLHALRWKIFKILPKFHCKYDMSCLKFHVIPSPTFCGRCWLKSKDALEEIKKWGFT